MMTTKEINHPKFGRSLLAGNGVVEIIVPLEYGIRIAHFSYIGEGNVFFEQPDDMTELTMEDGWRIHGGHRLWLAPEEVDVYHPDEDPVTCEVGDGSLVITQPIDPRLGVKKRMMITFGDGAEVVVTHKITNCNESTIRRSLWALSVMASGGTEYIPLGHREEEWSHWKRISWWDTTCLGDVRATYEKEQIILQHMPVKEPYKIGVGHPDGPIRYINHGVIFEKDYDRMPELQYPDGDASYETYLCEHMVEIETLSPLYVLAPGEEAQHKEIWRLRRDVQ